MILDGWGEGRHDYSNAIWAQGTPVIDGLRAKYPYGHLQACGEYVGLPDGQMGNSEVGHMNLGAGRVVYQDLVKINMAVRDHKFLDNAEIKAVYDYVKTSGKKLHLMGLTSHGGVHSSLEHVYEFLRVAKEYGLEQVYVHAFMDGRDTDPRSGKGFLEELEQKMAETTGKIATVCGRFYAMDRDKRWNRVKEAYDLLVEGKGAAFTSAIDGIQASYDADVTDEFIKPIVITDAAGAPLAKIEEGDAIIFYNFRNDRARELTTVLTQKDMPEEGMHTLPLYYCCLTPYDASFTGVHILFDKELVNDTLGETVSKAGKRQLDGEIRPRDLLLQRRPRAAVRERRPHPGELPEGAHLRPAAADERPRGGREADRQDQLGGGGPDHPELRQRRHGGPHGRVYGRDQDGRMHRQAGGQGGRGRHRTRLRGAADRGPRQRRLRGESGRYAEYGALPEHGPVRRDERGRRREGGEGRRPVQRGAHHPETDGYSAAGRNDRRTADLRVS